MRRSRKFSTLSISFAVIAFLTLASLVFKPLSAQNKAEEAKATPRTADGHP